VTGPHVQVIATGAAALPVAASEATVVVCADGGVRSALEARRTIDLVVGDLDSASDSDLDAARAQGARIERFPTAKDESDFELAMAAALGMGAASITVHLADGGRLDHQLANLLVLASPRWRPVPVDAWVGRHRVWVVHDSVVLPLAVGSGVAVQAVTGPATVTTRGLAFSLAGEVLHPDEARGIANEVVSTPVEVGVDGGVVLVIGSADQSAHAT
jgi:thiamine pyrophosphokinase